MTKTDTKKPTNTEANRETELDIQTEKKQTGRAQAEEMSTWKQRIK